MTKEDSFKLYVNEATITLNPSELIGRVGKARKITAEVSYTKNGDWSVPELSWTTTDADVATLEKASTLPGEENRVTFEGTNSAPAEIIVAKFKVGETVVASASATNLNAFFASARALSPISPPSMIASTSARLR